MASKSPMELLKPISKKLNSIKIGSIRRNAEALLRADFMNGLSDSIGVERIYTDADLAPVMPAIDAVQQLIEEENKLKKEQEKSRNLKPSSSTTSTESMHLKSAIPSTSGGNTFNNSNVRQKKEYIRENETSNSRDTCQTNRKLSYISNRIDINLSNTNLNQSPTSNDRTTREDELKKTVDSNIVDGKINIELNQRDLSSESDAGPSSSSKSFEMIPKSVILDVYSNDPEVKRFLKQILKIANEYGFNEQNYKCHSCRRPIGMMFGESQLCHFDGHQYCKDCHLGEKSIIPARILCNWDFTQYPISKRNQHFLKLIFNEPIFDIKSIAPLLYKVSDDLNAMRELRGQAYFIRSYCYTCVQESISFELKKLVWPREHLIKQIDLYSLDDLIQVKYGQLKQVLKSAIKFGTNHVLSCVLCRQKGFICEICKSAQIIYPFETEFVHRCNSCQSIYHKDCFKPVYSNSNCPRCRRLRARQDETSVISS